LLDWLPLARHVAWAPWRAAPRHLARDIQPEVVDRVNNAVRIAARQGHHQLKVMTFPCSYCNDGGGASTTCCPTGRRRSRASPSGTEFYERGAEAAGLQGHRPSCELRGRSARQHHHVPQMVSCSSMSRSDMRGIDTQRAPSLSVASTPSTHDSSRLPDQAAAANRCATSLRRDFP